MSAGKEFSLTAVSRDALACEAPRDGSGGCSPCGAISVGDGNSLPAVSHDALACEAPRDGSDGCSPCGAMSVGDGNSLTAVSRDALACEAPRDGSDGCSPCGAMSAGAGTSLTAVSREALACEAPRDGSGGCSPCGGADVRHLLALFTCARAMHRGVAAKVIASEAGLTVNQVRAVMRKGFSSACTREELAKWNGLEVVCVFGRAALRPVPHGRGAGALSGGRPCGDDVEKTPQKSGAGHE